MPRVLPKRRALPADWANMKDVITEIWKEKAKNVKDLVNILREEHNFITTNNICYKHVKKWGLTTYRKSTEEPGKHPQRKRKGSRTSTGYGDKLKPGPPAQSIPARTKLLPLRPSIQTLEIDKEFKLLLHSIDGLKIMYLDQSKFYLTRTGVKVIVTTQEQVLAVHQGWPQTWLGLAGLYNTLADEWQRLHREGRDEEIPVVKEKTTEAIYEGLQVFVRALNGYMPNEQESRVEFCNLFFRVMLTNVWQVCFRILDHDSTRPEYGPMFLTDFLIKFQWLVYTELHHYHPLTRMLKALCQARVENLRLVVGSAALLTVQGMVGNGPSNSVINFWRGTQATIPVSHFDTTLYPGT